MIGKTVWWAESIETWDHACRGLRIKTGEVVAVDEETATVKVEGWLFSSLKFIKKCRLFDSRQKLTGRLVITND